MTRIVKNPDERKQELLDCAMCLFIERGYEAVSMRDLAASAGVTPGLAYHYFDSKQALFTAVLESYANQCAKPGIAILDDTQLPLAQQIDGLMDVISQEESRPYHEFFHREGNSAFHDQLSVRLCNLLVPHLSAAITAEAKRTGAHVEAPQTLADFICHGLINLLSDPDEPDANAVAHVRAYINALVVSQLKRSDTEKHAQIVY